MIKTIIISICFQAKTEEHLEKEKQWLDSEKLWLMHRGGFTAVRKLDEQEQEPGKLKVRLEATGEILTVDEDDIEKVLIKIICIQVHMIGDLFCLFVNI